MNIGEKQLKSVAKSLRMTPEVYDFVMTAPGDGFNQKFENLVIDIKKSEPDRLNHICELDRMIQQKSMQLDKISRWVIDMDDVVRDALKLEDAFVTLQHKIEKILDD